MVRIASPERGTAESPDECGLSLPGCDVECALASGAFLDAQCSGVGGAAGGFAFEGLLVAVAVAHLRHGAEAGGELGLEVVETDAPGPVAGDGGWGVHAGFAAELENVLQRIDSDVRDGARGGADHVRD